MKYSQKIYDNHIKKTEIMDNKDQKKGRQVDTGQNRMHKRKKLKELVNTRKFPRKSKHWAGS